MRILYCLATLFSISAYGEEPRKPTSYSYFSIGTERINYQETISIAGANFKTDTTTENLVLLSGGRNFISKSLSFSINAMSTLYPNRVTEDWRLNNSILGPDDIDGDGSADSGATKLYTPQIVQSNRFTYSQATTQVVMHYHPDLWWSFDVGLSYSLGNFKRSAFDYKNVLVCDNSNRDCSGNSVVEETFAELSGMAGGSIHLPLSHKLRMSLSLVAGVPLKSRIENTIYPDLTFDSIEGWNSQATGSLMYQFNQNVSFGLAYDLQYQFKDRQGKISPSTQQSVYIPENVRIAQRFGAVASWVF